MATKWLIPALTYLCFVRGQSPCTTPDGKSGECKSIVMCEPLRSMTNKPGVAGDQKEFLKQSACGFDSTIPKVCCPTGQSCVTPENNAGQCVDILNCDHIKNRLSSPAVTQQDKSYVNSLRCQGPAPFSVCCGPPPGPTPGTRPTSAMEGDCVATLATAAPPDPASNCCGQHGDSNRILGGNTTAIDQYPWLALIEYKKDNKIKLLCGGVLISGRYVLTAGHCVAGTALNSGEPTNVRLGDYDISNAGKDCVQVEGGDPGTEDCTDNPVVIPIARIITHPEYNPRHPLRRNDIALLRLADMAPYTDFVRPICLPAIDVTGDAKNLGPGKLIAAGWGTVSHKNSNSIVKMHVDLPFKTMEDCQPAYMVPNRRVKLWDRQLCAGGVPGKDTCKGDSGGPLMFSDGHHVEVTGIVSFGPIPCGQNVPGVYTKVYEYVPWIRSNIQP